MATDAPRPVVFDTKDLLQSPLGRNSGGMFITQVTSDMDMLEGLIKTFGHGLGPRLVGIEASPELARFQAQNPLASMAAEVTGTLAAYSLPLWRKGALGIKLTAKLPLVNKLATYTNAKSPFKESAAKLVSMDIPIESTRVGLAAILADEDKFGDVVMEAGLNLTLAAGIGGGIGALAHSVPVKLARLKRDAFIRDKIPEYVDGSIPQEKLAQLRELTQKYPELMDDRMLQEFGVAQKELYKEVWDQSPVNRAMFGRIQDGEEAVGKKLARVLNDSFASTGVKGGLRVRKFTEGKDGFGNRSDMALARGRAGFEENNLEDLMFMRHVKTVDEAGQARLLGDDGIFARAGMHPVEITGGKPQAWMTREADGLWIVAKRIHTPAPQNLKVGSLRAGSVKARSGEEFVIFKTHKPDRYVRGHTEPSALTRNAFELEQIGTLTEKQYRTPVSDFVDRSIKAMPKHSNLPGVGRAQASEIFTRTLTKIHPVIGDASEGLRSITRRTFEGVRRFAAPLTTRFHNTTSRSAANIAHASSRVGKLMVRQAYFGKLDDPRGATVFSTALKTAIRRGGIDGKIDKAFKSPEGAEQIARIRHQELTLEEILEKPGEYNTEVRDLFSALRKQDLINVNLVDNTERALGSEMKWTPLESHFMISRSWTGDHRILMYDIDNPDKIAGVASGYTRKQALEQAETLRKEANALAETEGSATRLDYSRDPNDILLKNDPAITREQPRSALGSIDSSRNDLDIELALKIMPSSPGAGLFQRAKRVSVPIPGRFNPRSQAGLGAANNLDQKDFGEMVLGNMHETMNYVVGRNLETKLQPYLQKVKDNAPGEYISLVESINSMIGHRGPWQKSMDRSLDRLLGPVMGANSASTLARQTNRVMHTLTLGALDIGYAALNAITTIQTALPEIAFVTTSVPERLARVYDYTMVSGKGGTMLPVGHMSPLKIMAQATMDLKSKDPELIAAMAGAKRRGTLDAKLIEEVTGPTSMGVGTLKEAAKNGNWGDFTLKLSEWGPVKAEALSRAHAFLIGRRMAIDVMGKSMKEADAFADIFTARTMYQYGTDERSRVITGALGSAVGLFKNWGIHYIANMATYAGEATRGNFAPLLWQMAGTGAVAGAAGLPGYGIANSFSKMATDEDLMVNLYNAFGYSDADNPIQRGAIDAMFHGLPAFLGVSLQARAAVPGAAIVRDVNMLVSSVTMERAMTLGDAIGDAVQTWHTTGRHPITDRKILDKFIRALMPRTAYRFASFTEAGALKSLKTQNKLMGEATLSQRLRFTFGITPIDFEKHFEVGNILWEKQAEMRDAVTDHGAAWAGAMASKDYQQVREILIRSATRHLPVHSVVRSGLSKLRNLNEEQQKRQFEIYPRMMTRRSVLGRGNE